MLAWLYRALTISDHHRNVVARPLLSTVPYVSPSVTGSMDDILECVCVCVGGCLCGVQSCVGAFAHVWRPEGNLKYHALGATDFGFWDRVSSLVQAYQVGQARALSFSVSLALGLQVHIIMCRFL